MLLLLGRDESVVTLRGITRMFQTVKQPYRVVFLKFRKTPIWVTFQNGCKLKLTWPQFRHIRDNYPLLKNYVIEQPSAEIFRLKSDKFTFIGSLLIACLVVQLRQKYDIEQLEKDVFDVKRGNMELVGSAGILYTVREFGEGEYDCDCQGKVVLDIGGFEGESAVFFSFMGAKKVIVYEPVLAHHQFIQKNVRLNNVNAEIHEAGIGAEDGTQTLHYEQADLGFGTLSNGSREMTIKTESITKVIEKSHADVAKIDCEGSESLLLQVPGELLRKIDLYMIEVHTGEIRRALIEKFTASDFHIVKDALKNGELSVIFFGKNNAQNSKDNFRH